MLKVWIKKNNKRITSLLLAVMLTLTTSFATFEEARIDAYAAGEATAIEILLGLLASLGLYTASSASAQLVQTDLVEWVRSLGSSTGSTFARKATFYDELYTELITQGFNTVDVVDAVSMIYKIVLTYELGGTLYTDCPSESSNFKNLSVSKSSGLHISITYSDFCVKVDAESVKRFSFFGSGTSLKLSYEVFKIREGELESLAAQVGSLISSITVAVKSFINSNYKQASDNALTNQNSSVNNTVNNHEGTGSLRNDLIEAFKDFKAYESVVYPACTDLLNSLLANNDYAQSFINAITSSDGYSEDCSIVLSFFKNSDTWDVYSYLCWFCVPKDADLVQYYNRYSDSRKFYSYGVFDNNSVSYTCYYLFNESCRTWDFSNVKKLSSDKPGQYWVSYRSSCFYGFFDLCNSNKTTSDYSAIYTINFNPDRFYTSIDNYLDGISYANELNAGSLFGNTKVDETEDEVEVFIPDIDFYNQMISGLDAATSNQKKLNELIESIQAQYAQALSDMAQAIEEGDTQKIGFLQRILTAILALPDSILSGYQSDLKKLVTATAVSGDFLLTIDRALTDNLPLLDVINREIEKAGQAIDDANDDIVAALAPIGIISALNETVLDLGADVGTLREYIQDIADGTISLSIDDSIPIAVTDEGSSHQTEPEESDGFNTGFFALLAFIFQILYWLLRIFYHTMVFVINIYKVEASPYFLNDSIVEGYSYFKSIGIHGDLLNVTLYNFLFFLIRVVIIFMIIKLLRKRIERL